MNVKVSMLLGAKYLYILDVGGAHAGHGSTATASDGQPTGDVRWMMDDGQTKDPQSTQARRRTELLPNTSLLIQPVRILHIPT